MPIRPLLRRTLFVLAGTALLSGIASANERPADWAQPVDKSFNLYRLSPTLYRSALPDSDDLPLLHTLGMRTVVSLIKDDDRQWADGAALTTVSFPTHADRVDDADVIHVLNMLQSAQLQGPVLLHCKHGRDRTGLFIAMYRSVIQGWSKDEALREMVDGGFGNRDDMADAISYVRDADVDAIRQAMREGRCSTSLLSFCQLRELAGELAQYLFVPAQEDTLLAEDELQKVEGSRG